MYNELIVVYLFLGGASGGSFFIMTLVSLWFHSRESRLYHRRLRMAFRIMKCVVYSVSLFMLLIALVCLFADLKAPDQVLALVTHPRPTPLTFGFYILSLQLVLGAALVVANVLRPRITSGKAKRLLEAVCAVNSLAVMAYTAIYLYCQKAVALWDSPWLIAVFVASSLSAGISIVLLCDWIAQGKVLLLHAAKPLQRAHIGILVVEATVLAAYAFAVANNPETAKSLQLLTSPALYPVAAFGAVGMGILVPLVLETYALTFKYWRAIPISDVVCLIGGFCLRWCLIMGGAH